MLPLLLAPLVTIAENVAVAVALDRVAKFRKDTNWTTVKIDGDRKLRDLIPGDAADDVVIRAYNAAMDKIQAALGETAEIEKVLKLLADGNFVGATKELMAHAVSGATAA